MRRTWLGLLACSLLAIPLVGPAPAEGAVISLTSLGASGNINGALFSQGDLGAATGTGVIDAFVRLQAAGSESGYNTDGKLEFDTKSSPHTRSLPLKDVPRVTLGGVVYREFTLDIDETNNGGRSRLSLDELKIHVEGAGDLSGYPGSFSAPIYNLDAGGDNWIILDAGLGSGSGSGDMFAYFPSALFGPDGGRYVYLYSKFGLHEASDGGFEEWAVKSTPEPGALSLLVLGACASLRGLRSGRQVR